MFNHKIQYVGQAEKFVTPRLHIQGATPPRITNAGTPAETKMRIEIRSKLAPTRGP
jgi:hypothetical protein